MDIVYNTCSHTKIIYMLRCHTDIIFTTIIFNLRSHTDVVSTLCSHMKLIYMLCCHTDIIFNLRSQVVSKLISHRYIISMKLKHIVFTNSCTILSTSQTFQKTNIVCMNLIFRNIKIILSLTVDKWKILL
ncbi:hypothetical protein C0J52_16652 [Blattella germanica]|nr:hypothetical protein C0J52_16652 [Blattella germanica]